MQRVDLAALSLKRGTHVELLTQMSEGNLFQIFFWHLTEIKVLSRI